MQISIVMLTFLLLSDQILGGGNIYRERGKLLEGGDIHSIARKLTFDYYLVY